MKFVKEMEIMISKFYFVWILSKVIFLNAGYSSDLEAKEFSAWKITNVIFQNQINPLVNINLLLSQRHSR